MACILHQRFAVKVTLISHPLVCKTSTLNAIAALELDLGIEPFEVN